MSGSAATHSDAGTPKLMAHGGPGNAQLSTDLAQTATLGVQVGCALDVHRATVTTLSRIGFNGCELLKSILVPMSCPTSTGTS
jgi:hypothetical protein